MTRKTLAIGTAVALTLGVAAWGVNSLHAQPYGGWGMMGGYGQGPTEGYGPGPGGYGPGMMQGYGPGYGPHGPGMMQGFGRGHGPGMMRGFGPGWGQGGPGAAGPGPQGNLNLSTDQVKSNIERWLAWRGNPRLKVGDVKEKDADTIEANIVTKDNSLVQKFVVNRHTGFFQPSGD